MATEHKQGRLHAVCIALGSAFLFGASTPAAKSLIGQIHPQLLAGLLYLGSGLGLLLLRTTNRIRLGPESREANLLRSDAPWLVGAVVFGGIIGPLMLTVGLSTTTGSAASLLLNMEAVFTALLAWFAFKENFDRRIFIGMVAIVVGSLILAWQPGAFDLVSIGSMLVIGACFCWAIDNNFTRNISDADPIQIAAIKGLAAGTVNTIIALACGHTLPSFSLLLVASLVGFCGYAVSLVLFIKALRLLGTARTGAYFSTAPFAGTLLSVLFLHESLTPNILLASAFMAFGVWLHLTENHEHEHFHPEEEHEHMHVHDEHHQHSHEHEIQPEKPHSHWHRHEPVTHSHPHYPDTSHRHEH